MTLIKPLNLTMTDTICQYELNTKRTYFVYFEFEIEGPDLSGKFFKVFK